MSEVVSWDATKSTLNIKWAGDETGESVVIAVERDLQKGTYLAVTDQWGGMIWDGPGPNSVVLTSAVQAISISGSPYHDYIDLRQVTPGPNLFKMAPGAVTVDCSAALANFTVGDTIFLGAFGEDVMGSPYADTIKSNQNYATGDVVNGNGGADTITGGPGNDELTLGGLGPDDNIKGPGFDTKTALIEGGGGNDTIIGGNMHSKLYGNSGNNYIAAGPWGDTLVGGSGDDTLYGSTGTDTITGSERDDEIVCDTVNNGDKVTPGKGNNYIYDFGKPNTWPNDYKMPNGNHPAVGGLKALGDSDDPQTNFEVGDIVTLKVTGLRIPTPSLSS